MRIAITGATGFVGSHLITRLAAGGHELVLIARSQRVRELSETSFCRFVISDLSNPDLLVRAFADCEAVFHCAGINRELGQQTYKRVHVEATANLIEAAKMAGVRKLVFMSFLRARAACGSPYHESKWAAEELVRASGLDYTIAKCGMVYGRGDHMLDHLSHSLSTLPFFAAVGCKERAIRPVAVVDLIEVLMAALFDARLSRKTAAVVGAEELFLSEAAKRVASVLRRRILVFPAPIWFHRLLAQVFELTMKVPLVAKAQVQILSEGVVEAAPSCESLPHDLLPKTHFTSDQIRRGLPEAGPFTLRDLRCWS